METDLDVAWLAGISVEGELAALLAAHRASAPPVEESPADLVRRCASGDLDLGLGDAARLAAIVPSRLDGEGRVQLIEALERVRSQIDGLQQYALASAVEATEQLGLPGEFARWEVAAALKLCQATADRRTQTAAAMLTRLPSTLGALRAGSVSYLQASHLTEALCELDDEAAAEVERRVLRKAPDQTLAETRRSVARAVIAADPEGADRRRRRAVRGRRIERHSQPEAMEGWWLTLPAHVAQSVWGELSRRARTEQQERRARGEDDPGIDALRVDGLVAAVLTSTDAVAASVSASVPAARVPDQTAPRQSATLPRCRCGGAQVAAVVVDLPTLLGLAEHPGELTGYGPIPADLARELARDRDWVRWTIDPGTRRLLDRGANSYRPTELMRAFLTAAHRVCGFPGCPRSADQCDVDHTITFRRKGRTVVRNLGPLCRQHHNAKTHGRWRLTFDDETGGKTWTSPLGRTYPKGIDPILE